MEHTKHHWKIDERFVYEDESEVIKTFVSTCGSKAVKYRTHEFTRQNNTNVDLPASI